MATAPVLVLVGAMMMGESTHIDWSSMLTAIPAFLTIVIQPFTFSIANGIYAGTLTVMGGEGLLSLGGVRSAKSALGWRFAACGIPLLHCLLHCWDGWLVDCSMSWTMIEQCHRHVCPPTETVALCVFCCTCAGLVMTVLLYILTGQFMEYFQPTVPEKDNYYEDIEEAEEDLETPLVNGHGHGHTPLPPAAAAAAPIAYDQRQQQQEGIPIGSVRRSSYGATGTPMGSYRGRGTPYERGSFTMYINTFGSHTSPAARGLLGSHPASEEPEH